MSEYEQVSHIIGTLCDVKGVEKPVNSTGLKDLLCDMVEYIATRPKRELHAHLHGAYKKFANSTPVEIKLTDKNKLECFNKVRDAVQADVHGLMESLAFGPRETEAIAKLISAGSASERVGYMRSPPGINMNDLLTRARELLEDKTEPNEQDPSIRKHRSSTEFWSAEDSRRKSGHRREAAETELFDTDSEHEVTTRKTADPLVAEAKTFTPEVDFDDEAISQKERRKSLELVTKCKVPGGQFTGAPDDRRSVRKVLKWIKRESEDKCFTPLETYFLIRECFDARFTKLLSRSSMRSQSEVNDTISTNIAELLRAFAPTLQSERNRLRRLHVQFKPKFKESLQDALVRYDELLEDLADVEIPLTEADKVSVFMDALSDEQRLLAVTVQENTKNKPFEIFKGRLITYSQNRVQRTSQFPPKKNDQDGPPSDPQRREAPKVDHNRQEINKDNGRKPPFQKKWHAKKNEANVVDGGYSDVSDEEEADSLPDSEVELNLIEIGIPSVIQLPKITENSEINLSHYSNDTCGQHGKSEEKPIAELNQVHLANAGPKAATLTVTINGSSIDALVDSGATRSLVDVGFMKVLAQGKLIDGARHVEVDPMTITYADGRKTQIRHAVELPVKVKVNGRQRRFQVQFLLIPKLQRGILLGRDAMEKLGIHLVVGDKPINEKTRAPRGEASRQNPRPETESCMVVECNRETAIVEIGHGDEELLHVDPSGEDLDQAEKDLLYHDGCQNEEHPILQHTRQTLQEIPSRKHKRSWDAVGDEEIQECIKELLRALKDKGWMQMADGYLIRITDVRGADKRDTKGQQFRFEVTWSIDSQNAQARKPWNSQNTINRLSEDQRHEWDKQIHGYVEQEWWVADENCHSRTPGATVFPVLQCSEKTTTVRPCSDFRLLNAISPKVSSATPSVSQAVWRLRSQLRPGVAVYQLDLAKAFYRIHTIVRSEGERVPLVLRIGNHQYVSDRLVFGLSCGPQGLICSQLITDAVVRECARILYTSDCQMSNPIAVMDDFVHVGPTAQCDQTIRVYDIAWNLTGFECPVNKRAIWNENTPVRWLGQHYQWDPPTARLSMHRSQIVIPSRESWTKRQSFRSAGQFTSNTGSLHEALARVHADSARAISGKAKEWDQQLDPEKSKAITYHLTEALRCWNKARDEDTNIPLLYDVSRIDIFTDASATGMGMVIMGEGRTLFAEGKLFKESSKSWHVNRRELYALARAVLRTDNLISNLQLTEINAHTDSRVARAQTDPWRNVTSKSLERQVLLRLKNCIIEISSFWKLRGTQFTVKYIQGHTNVAADALSRVRSKGPTVSEIELNIADVSHQIDELRGFQPFKYWLLHRQAFFAWSNKPDPLADDPALVLRGFIRSKQKDDDLCKRIAENPTTTTTKFYTIESDGLIMRKSPHMQPQVLIPDPLLRDLLAHVHKQSGHASPPATLAHFFKACYHPKARKTLKQVVKGCEGCNRASNKANGQTVYGEVQQPPHPFHTVGIDLYGPLQRGTGHTSKSKKCIFTFCDRLTGWTQFRVLHNAKSHTVARVLEEFLYMFGPQVKVLYTDGGPQFAESPIIPGICKMWGIQQRILPPYTPHLGGFYEIRHKTATATLRSILAEKPLSDWQTIANIAAARINSHAGPDRTSAPHKLIFGWDYSLPTTTALANAGALTPAKPDDALFESAAEREALARTQAREEMLEVWKIEYMDRQKLAAERFTQQLSKTQEELKVGDKVYLVKQMITRKFDSRSTPYRLIEKLGQSVWKAQSLDDEDKKIIRVHARHLRKAEEVEQSDGTKTPSGEARGGEERVESGSEKTNQGPPVTKINRTTHEMQFLTSIQGQVSRSGRIRRGSYVQTIKK